LTPYRLVTTGADGLARTWDIREACLKRYGGLIGKRPEYQRRLTEKERSAAQQSAEMTVATSEAGGAVVLPPIPVRQNDSENGNDRAVGQLPLPPLPPPPGVAGGQNHIAGGLAENPGAFVANDAIDEGVKLIAKLQHGASVDERMGGQGTRARRAPVKVICVARCPHGGHFATGSDDGICRIWQDDDDTAVETVDRRLSGRSSAFTDSNDMAQRTRQTSRRKLGACSHVC
jgi:WD40 repeat protein